MKPLLARPREDECIEYKITYPGHLKVKIERGRIEEVLGSIEYTRTAKVTLAEVDGKPAILVSLEGKPKEWKWYNAKLLFRREPVVHLLIESWTIQSKLYEILTGKRLVYMEEIEAAKRGIPAIQKYPIKTMILKEHDAIAVIPIVRKQTEGRKKQ